MPRKPLANLGYLLNGMRSLTSLRIESDSPLPTNIWGPLSTRLHGLNKLRIWAPSISGSQLLRSLSQAPQRMTVLHLIGADNDISDDAILSIVQSAPSMQSLVIHSANITARSAAAPLGYCRNLTHLELARDQPEADNYSDADSALLPAVASRLNTLSVRNLGISDALVQSAALAIFGLRTLYISGAAALTGIAVGELLRSSTQLAALGLHNCPKLSDSALQGLAQGLSAPTLRVLLIHQCAVQSEGIERVLASFHAIRHFSVKGTEVVRQQFQYAYVATNNSVTDPVAEPQPLPVQRSFKPVYPADHFFIKSDIQNQPEKHSAVILPFATEAVKDGQRLLEPSSPLIKNAFSENSAKRFVPGLMAFTNCFQRQEAYSRIGRPRAATVSFVEQGDSSELVEDVQPISRPRSISELPASLESITQEVEPITENIADETDLDLVATSDGDTSTEVVRDTEIANETATFDIVPRSLDMGNLEIEPATLNKRLLPPPRPLSRRLLSRRLLPLLRLLSRRLLLLLRPPSRRLLPPLRLLSRRLLLLLRPPSRRLLLLLRPLSRRLLLLLRPLSRRLLLLLRPLSRRLLLLLRPPSRRLLPPPRPLSRRLLPPPRPLSRRLLPPLRPLLRLLLLLRPLSRRLLPLARLLSRRLLLLLRPPSRRLLRMLSLSLL
ncbi:hypothetical protein BX661DRAFT_47793 [Kickxella alabastrina]|uniref:uncharacterized protein n=1 Tax=Kickxella alabastrina TaxID=61397 RepID=UPI0022207196|nr:uncharacterized protein BX661DRAFT_47793 [Kickxella alabastrina]KAI7824264.1 hypothetical protein BX661DRAFT_47793 [Kickxella alabastrina]